MNEEQPNNPFAPVPTSPPAPASTTVDTAPPAAAAVDAVDVVDAAAAAPAVPKGPRFADLGLRPEVLRAIDEMGFQEAMPVQAVTLPKARQGGDLMVQSRTGSGKTAAFGIPFVNDVVKPDEGVVQALVLLPTRELALQVAAELAKIAAHRPITVAPIYGGAPMGRQVELLRAGAQIVCGTPGRVLDHIRRGTLKLDRVRCVVLDECDEMLSMGFQEDIEAILERTPETRQTLLFSATVPEGIQRLSRRFLRNPEFLKLSADFVGVHEIRHVYYAIPGVNREQELLRILNFEEPKTAIIFCNTREETGRVAEFLRKNGFQAEAISSDLAQNDRERVMANTRAGQVRFLVATDVAARGIDIEGLTHVINYTFPESPEVYIHRTGRTGRAGKHGTAISLIGPTEVGSFYYLKLLYKIKPEERALPSEAEIRSHREGERVLHLRERLTGEPGNEWRALARRLMIAVDGERLVAALLAHAFASVEGMPVMPKPIAMPVSSGTRTAETGARRIDPGSPSAASPRATGERDRGGERGRTRDRGARPERGDRDRDRPRERGRERDDRGPRRRDEARPVARAAAPGVSSESPGTGSHEGEKEFWEVWSDEKAARDANPSAGSVDVAADVPTPGEEAAPPARERDRDRGDRDRDRGDRDRDRGDRGRGRRDGGSGEPPELAEGMARLYLNLGRKDGAGDSEIRDLLRDRAGVSEVDSLDVMNTHTYLNVRDEDAERIIAGLTGQQLGERDLICERAKPRRR